jgi:hypothetical protein
VLKRPSPSAVGARTELAVATELWRAGFAVFTPYFNAHSRVDLMYIRRDGVIIRLQCKTGRVRGGYVSFWACSHTGQRRQGYAGDVDEFAVYAEELRAVYLVPLTDVAATEVRLRLKPPRNNQVRGIRYADSYLLRLPQ